MKAIERVIHERERLGRAMTPSLFARRCSELVEDLYKPSPGLYWADFLISFGMSLISFVVFHRSAGFFITITSFIVAGLGIYRCSVFIHEIQHHPVAELRSFAKAWNAAFGIPCLMPLFLYDEHCDHHSVVSYGTHKDPEYAQLRSEYLIRFISLMSLSLVYPLLGPLRFGLMTPLALMSKRFNSFVYTRLSSLYNLKRGYRRRRRAQAESHTRWFQEISCFLWVWVWIYMGVIGMIEPIFFLKTYLLFAFWMVVNQLRTLTAHRYASKGSAEDFLFQLLDTNTFDRGWVTTVWAPLGLRYHALHHLLPGLPYHNLALAHRRLMNSLPPESPYHETRQMGLINVIWQSFSSARDSYPIQKKIKSQ